MRLLTSLLCHNPSSCVQSRSVAEAAAIRALGNARVDEVRDELLAVETALAHAQQQNRDLWAQLDAVADTVEREAPAGFGPSSLRASLDVGAARGVGALETPFSRSVPLPGADGSKVGAAGHVEEASLSPVPEEVSEKAGGDSGAAATAAAGVVASPVARPRTSSAGSIGTPVKTPSGKGAGAWNRPLNFKDALLQGAARSAAAAAQGVGTMPMSPAGKAPSLRGRLSDASLGNIVVPSGSLETGRLGSSALGLAASLDFADTAAMAAAPSQPGATEQAAGTVEQGSSAAATPASADKSRAQGLQLLNPDRDATGSGTVTPTNAASERGSEVGEEEGLAAEEEGAMGLSGGVGAAGRNGPVPDVAASVSQCLGAMRAQARTLQDRLESATAELADLRQRLHDTSTEVAATSRHLYDVEAAKAEADDAARKRQAALQQQLAAEAERLAAALADTKAAQEAQRKLADEVEGLKSTQADLEQQLVAAAAAHDHLEQQLVTATAERDALRVELADTVKARDQLVADLAAETQARTETQQRLGEAERRATELQEQLQVRGQTGVNRKSACACAWEACYSVRPHRV